MKIMDKFTKEELQQIVDINNSYAGCLRYMGYTCITGETTHKFQKKLIELKIDTSKFNTTAALSDKSHKSDEEVFKTDSEVHQTTLRKRYSKLFPPAICSICGISTRWNEKELSLILDHINGLNHDNRLENLRWVCPNCNSQLSTTGSRNKKIIKTEPKEYICKKCGKKITQGHTFCQSCSKQEQDIKWRNERIPDRDVFKQLIRNKTFTSLEKALQVSARTIGRWCEYYNLPHKKSDINSYSDEEWDKI